MDQENKKSQDNIALSFDEEAFNSLWDDSQSASEGKPSGGVEETLSAASLGRALDWGELAKDDDLWSGLDRQLASQANSIGTIGIALSSLEAMASKPNLSDESHVDLSADIALLERKVQEKVAEKAEKASDGEAPSKADDLEDQAGRSGDVADTEGRTDRSGDVADTEARTDGTAPDADRSEGESEGEGDEVVSASSLLTEDMPEEEIRLSERARMGRFEPENEVETSEHVLDHDTYYTDAQCVTRDPEKIRRRIIWLVAAVIGILLGVLIYFAFTMFNGETHIQYTQKGVFQMSSSEYAHVYASPGTRQTVICSDARGIVFDQGNFVAEFWPDSRGCREVRLSRDGKSVWYLGKNEDSGKDTLFYVSLEASADGLDKATGFNPVELRKLQIEDRIGQGFDVAQNTLYYFAKPSDGVPELRRTRLDTQETETVKLPEDAIPCSGRIGRSYGYVSGASIVTVGEDGKQSASLEAPKLGCGHEQVISCALGPDRHWSVLCKESVVFGQGDKAETPVQMDDAGIRDGRGRFVLLRNQKGTDLVTESYWRHIDSSVDEKLMLSHPLVGSFEFGARSSKNEGSLYGTDGGLPIKILRSEQSDGGGYVGQVVQLAMPEAVNVLGSVFVSEGKTALVLSEDMTQSDVKTRLGFWKLSAGVLQQVISLDGKAVGVNVSPDGNAGFVHLKVQSGDALVWFDWKTGESIGKTELASGTEISDVLWSEDGRHAIIAYANGTSSLFVRENEMKLVRASGAVVAFASNDLLWRAEKDRVMNERISDGALSVLNSALEPYLEGFEVTGITVHPATADVLLWGPAGMLDYNTVNGKVMKVTGKPIRWVTPDHLGKYLVTSEGLLDLSLHSIMPLPLEADAARMMWSGSNRYLVSSDMSRRMNIVNPSMEVLSQNGVGIRLYGANAGMHPTSDYMFRMRSRLTSLELVTEHVQNLAVFGGNSMESWCFKTAAGLVQGVGRKCRIPVRGNVDAQEAVLPEADAQIAKQMDSLMSVSMPKVMPREPVPFKEDVKLSVATVPDKVNLVFVSESGAMPEALGASGDIVSPFEVALRRDGNAYRVDVAAEGFEPRSVSFELDREHVALHIPLLREGASVLSVKAYEASNGSEVQMPEDLVIEVKSAVAAEQKAILKCLKRQPEKVLKLTVSEESKLGIVADGLTDKEKNCLEPVLSDLESRREAEMPGLSELHPVRLDIQFP